MRHIRVTYSNGQSIETEINGSTEDIERYYLGKVFNLGVVEDNMQIALRVEFLDGKDK
jgi:ribosomal protein L21E